MFMKCDFVCFLILVKNIPIDFRFFHVIRVSRIYFQNAKIGRTLFDKFNFVKLLFGKALKIIVNFVKSNLGCECLEV